MPASSHHLDNIHAKSESKRLPKSKNWPMPVDNPHYIQTGGSQIKNLQHQRNTDNGNVAAMIFNLLSALSFENTFHNQNNHIAEGQQGYYPNRILETACT